MTLARTQPEVVHPTTNTVSTRSLIRYCTTAVWKNTDGPVLQNTASYSRS